MGNELSQELEALFVGLRERFGERADDAAALIALQLGPDLIEETSRRRILSAFARRLDLSSHPRPVDAMIAYFSNRPLPPELIQELVSTLRSKTVSLRTSEPTKAMGELIGAVSARAPVPGTASSTSSMLSLRLGRGPKDPGAVA